MADSYTLRIDGKAPVSVSIDSEGGLPSITMTGVRGRSMAPLADMKNNIRYMLRDASCRVPNGTVNIEFGAGCSEYSPDTLAIAAAQAVAVASGQAEMPEGGFVAAQDTHELTGARLHSILDPDGLVKQTNTPANLAELAATVGRFATEHAIAVGIEQSMYSGGRDVYDIESELGHGFAMVEYGLEIDDVDSFHDEVLDTLAEIDIKELGCDPERVLDAVRDKIAEGYFAQDDWKRDDVCDDIAFHVVQAVGKIDGIDASKMDEHEVSRELASNFELTPAFDLESALEEVSIRSEIVAGERGDARNEFGHTDDLLHMAADFMWCKGRGETFDDWCAGSDDFLDKDGNFQIPDDMHGTYLESFCDEQGTSFADIVNGADGPFAESMRDEIEAISEGGYGHSVCVMMRQDLQSFVEDMCAAEGSDSAARSMTIKAASEPNLHLFSPESGSGIGRGIELTRDMTIKSDEIAGAIGEYESRDRWYSAFNGMHTIDETCCGLVNNGAGPQPWDWTQVEYGEYGDCRGGQEAGESLDEMCEAKSEEAEIGSDERDAGDTEIEER